MWWIRLTSSCAQDPGTARYGPEMVYAKGTAGLYEVEPSMRWNPAVVAGVGMIQDPRPLYDDMHAYLAQSGVPGRACPSYGTWDLMLDEHTFCAYQICVRAVLPGWLGISKPCRPWSSLCNSFLRGLHTKS